MDFLWEYLSFLLKVLTVVLAFACMLALATKAKATSHTKIRMRHVNKIYQDLKIRLLAVWSATGSGYAQQCLKEEKKAIKSAEKIDKKKIEAHKKMFLLSFKGNLSADGVAELREEITALLLIASPGDEACLRLESPGGAVNGYGLLAAQLLRMKAQGVRLVVCVDKVAASGGYLAACVADRLIASPFALIGSIGVVATIPNVHAFLKAHRVDVLELTAGKHKRPLSMLGKPSKEGISHVEKQLAAIHKQFSEAVCQHRPDVEADAVCNGDYWTAQEALGYHLVDEIQTSDDYIQSLVQQGPVFELNTPKPKRLLDKLQSAAVACYERLVFQGL